MSVPDEPRNDKGDEWALYRALRQTPPDDTQVPVEPEDGPPVWEAETVPWPTVPWPRARGVLDTLSSLTAAEYAAVYQELRSRSGILWRQGHAAWLSCQSDRALLVLLLSVEAEVVERFGSLGAQALDEGGEGGHDDGSDLGG